jgi:ATP-dependent DNA helicase DinG
VVVAHNAPFDRAFLAKATEQLGLPFPEIAWVDTLALARVVWPSGKHTLSALRRQAGLEPLAIHRALPDAETAGRVFLALLSATLSKGERVVEGLLPPESWGWLPAIPKSLPGAFAQVEALPGFSRRPTQRAYAAAAARAFTAGEIALLEAGPGIGKTYGYLIPLLLALRENGRAVVATRTRALQEQLFGRDLPALERALGLKVPAALLKGRENYLCPRRLEEAKFALYPRELLDPLLAWAERTRTGDLDEMAAIAVTPEGRRLLAEVRDIPYRCGGPACPDLGRCPSRRARERARAARLVVVNHALLGADIALGKLLGPYEFLVVDEAHGFPPTLREALSLSLSPAMVPRLLSELHQDAKGGTLSRWARLIEVRPAVRAWEEATQAHRSLWAALSQALPEETGRYSEEGLHEAAEPARILVQTLRQLADHLERIAPALPEEEEELARGLLGECRRLSSLVWELLFPTGEDLVFWYAREAGGLTLYASPIDLGEILAERLWPRLRGAVFTSATLAAGGEAAPLSRELGLDQGAVSFRRFPSPFPYTNVRAYALRFLPHPDDQDYPRALGEVMRVALGAAPRRALALFTSRRLLEATLGHLGGLPTLAQGRDGEREALLARFREHPPPVLLLGLDTLWEGIDLPGEELELLFVTRLPFPVPTDPVAQAEAERLAEGGGDPFWELALPRAVLRLRQGVGRLVRTPEDRGAIIIADPRVTIQGYGRWFLRELPVKAQLIDSAGELSVALGDLFR